MQYKHPTNLYSSLPVRLNIIQTLGFDCRPFSNEQTFFSLVMTLVVKCMAGFLFRAKLRALRQVEQHEELALQRQ